MFANDAKNMQNDVYIIIYYSILSNIKSYSLLFYSILIICWLLLSTFLATLAKTNYIFAVYFGQGSCILSTKRVVDDHDMRNPITHA